MLNFNKQPAFRFGEGASREADGDHRLPPIFEVRYRLAKISVNASTRILNTFCVSSRLLRPGLFRLLQKIEHPEFAAIF